MESQLIPPTAAILNIAIMCHQANKAWCEVNGDTSQKDWYEAEDWQKESAINGVRFRLTNPTAGKDAQHNAWMAEKIEQGWKYGPEKNVDEKLHPCIVPFEELPEFQQKKDALFCAIVDALQDKDVAEIEVKEEEVVLSVKSLSNAEKDDLRQGKGTFGDAIKAAQEGFRITRAGWNGKGIYAYIVPANSYPALTDIAKKEFGDNVPYREYWALKTAQNDVATWAPSGSDSLATDWTIVE